MATPYNSGNWLAGMVGSMALLVFPEMTTLLIGVSDSATTIRIAEWQWLWPQAGTFVLQIGAERMIVTGGHGGTLLRVLRGQLATAAAAHSPGADISWFNPFPDIRVFEGSAPTDPETEAGLQFIQRIQLDGPAIQIDMPRGRKTNDWHHTKYDCDVTIFFGTAQNKKQSLVDLLSLIELIKDLWYTQSTWPAGAPSQIIEYIWEKSEIDHLQNPAFGTVKIMAHTEM